MLVAAGCGSSGGEPAPQASGTDDPSRRAQARIERCTDRFVRRIKLEDFPELTPAQARRYVKTTYCAMFEKHGLVYDDGTLSIEVYTDSRSAVCASSRAGEPARTVPCEDVIGDYPVLDCAVLHHVRRSEVQKYLAELRETREVRCDDGTPLDELGAE